ncbi:hypothetical protein A0H81_14142 [Grifola frondosa]|uniref:Uncharacterized protein n=1 Tax=Grifola frondosa TaxID=5627 RepID=A0A1C7LT48_GRIFR|nr:hypothetical protein A0H81_14142 [Grifola frondosa]
MRTQLLSQSSSPRDAGQPAHSARTSRSPLRVECGRTKAIWRAQPRSASANTKLAYVSSVQNPCIGGHRPSETAKALAKRRDSREAEVRRPQPVCWSVPCTQLRQLLPSAAGTV